MKFYIKPQSEIVSIGYTQIIATSPSVSNCLYEGDDTDSDYGMQFSSHWAWEKDDDEEPSN